MSSPDQLPDHPRWQGINHLALVTPDMDATVRFWHGVLDARLVGTIGIPAFLLALAPSTGPWRPEGFLRAIARFSIPAGLATGLGILATYLLARHAFGNDLTQARSATAATVVVSGLAIVFALEDQPGTRRLVVGALCVAMALLFFGACAIPVAREFFEIASPTGGMVGAWLIGSAVAVALLAVALRIVAVLDRRAAAGEAVA